VWLHHHHERSNRFTILTIPAWAERQPDKVRGVPMRIRTVPALLLVTVLLVVAAVIAGVMAGQQTRLADSADAGSNAVDNGAVTGDDHADGLAGSATPSPDASGKAVPKSKTPTPGTPNNGKEANPSAPTAVPYRLPGSKPLATPQPLVDTPLPPSASARGSIVKGFPAVIPQAPKSAVTFSSIATQDKRMQVGLDATTTISAADVLAYYRTVFEPLGLVAAAAPAAGGSTALAFARGDNGITVTVSGSVGSSNSHYTVTGVLSAGT
jgi:hypothetical protein